MRILVTGGAGFIASNVVDALIEEGHDVSVVDNLSSGFERNLNPRARFYRLSVRGSELSDVFEKELPECRPGSGVCSGGRQPPRGPDRCAQVRR